jgi:hypothetical protein
MFELQDSMLVVAVYAAMFAFVLLSVVRPHSPCLQPVAHERLQPLRRVNFQPDDPVDLDLQVVIFADNDAEPIGIGCKGVPLCLRRDRNAKPVLSMSSRAAWRAVCGYASCASNGIVYGGA